MILRSTKMSDLQHMLHQLKKKMQKSRVEIQLCVTQLMQCKLKFLPITSKYIELTKIKLIFQVYKENGQFGY